MRLMYSGREFAWLYERCDQLAFSTATCGVCLPGRVDGVRLRQSRGRRSQIVGRAARTMGRFFALVSHYLFEPTSRGSAKDMTRAASRAGARR